MTYLIFGASGRSGTAIGRKAARKGEKVVGVIRDPEQSKALKELGIHSIVLDIGKATPDDYVALFRKVKPRVIIWAAGTSNNDLAKYIDYGAQVKVYDAMVKAKVRRVVTVSSMGVWDWKSDGAEWFTKEELERVGRISKVVPYVVQAKYEAESHLHTLDLDWTVIRPGGLTQAETGGVSLGKVRLGGVPREAVADVILASVPNEGMYRRTVDCVSGSHSAYRAVQAVVEENVDTFV